MSSSGATNGWSLEVVRGRDTGKLYALAGGVNVLGNALGGVAGIDLADQEGAAPRKMAARQASIESQGASVVLRDLDSPGGTFVNRQRVLSGQSRPLQPGDLIQVGGVQLKLVHTTPKAQTATPARADSAPTSHAATPAAPAGRAATVGAQTFLFNLKCGSVCRSWDDFLKVSAQRWSDLRDELVSGRLAAFLLSSGQGALVPDPQAPGSADERLDAWLGRLPVSRPAKPELDVHPKTLVIRAKGGGGITSARVQITNTGYRLLRSTVRTEPQGTPWLKLCKEVDGRSIVTVEATDVPLEIRIPENVTRPLDATLVVDSNGGTARIKVLLEPASVAASELAEAAPAVMAPGWRWDPRLAIERQSLTTRLVGWAVAAAGFRLLAGLASGIAAQFGIGRVGDGLSLAGPAIALAAVGAFLGARFAIARKEWRDVFVAAFAAACAGIFAAAVVVAICQAIEGSFAGLQSSHAALKVILWGVLGVLAAGLSVVIVPPTESARKKEPAA
jgi:hypothetical protein